MEKSVKEVDMMKTLLDHDAFSKVGDRFVCYLDGGELLRGVLPHIEWTVRRQHEGERERRSPADTRHGRGRGAGESGNL